jgi:hypothetical protein
MFTDTRRDADLAISSGREVEDVDAVETEVGDLVAVGRPRH